MPAAATLDCPSRPLDSPATATVEQVASWMESLPSFKLHAQALREHQVDALVLSMASAKDLTLATHMPFGVTFKLKRCFDLVLEDEQHETKAESQPVMDGSTSSYKANITGSKGQQRSLQEDLCDGTTIETMLAQCCADSDGGHRRAQSGCETLPATCTPACAGFYVPFYQSCSSMVASLGDQAGFDELYAQCQVVQSAQPALPSLPPTPTPSHCVDSATWISDTESAGCAQYAPGDTTYQAMCAVHLGRATPGVPAAQMKITAAQACPVACGLCPSCDDGKQNGGETGIDCGGPCAACVLAPSCGPIESSGLIGPNMEAVCTGQAVGDTCETRPHVGFRPSTPSAALQQCAAGSECHAMESAMFAVPARNVIRGNFVCTETGRWEGEPLLVLPILPTVCPAQILGDHYTANCESGADRCIATCEKGYPIARGDGVFTCQGGVWIGDLICEPISCGLTLDKASPEESAFTVCTSGETLGSECVAFCREGFYSTVGTGVGSFKCMDEAGGLWMQQGFSPWWESSLQCTRCPVIENCDVSSCTTGTDAQCSACAEGFYGYRHDETPTRCLPNSVSISAAGFDADAAGIFSVVFSGTLGADFRDDRITTSVMSTSSLSLTGTRVEPVAMNFVITGGVLSLRDLNMVASSLQVSEVGQIAVLDCVGSFSDVNVRDSTLEMRGAPPGLDITGYMQLYTASNLEDVRITSVTFVDARISVQSSTTLRMESCSGSLIPPSNGNRGNGLTVLESTVHINNTMPAGFHVTGLQVRSSAMTIDATPGQVSGSVDLRSSGTIRFSHKTMDNVALELQEMESVAMDSCDVAFTSAHVQATSWDVLDCQGSMSSIDITENSHVSVTGGHWSMSTAHVSQNSHVDMTTCTGSVSGLRVDGRADTGTMGSCESDDGMYCSEFSTSIESFVDACTTFSPVSELSGSGCTSSGSVHLCDPSRVGRVSTHSTNGGSSCGYFAPGGDRYHLTPGDTGCDDVALGSTWTVDATTATSTTFGCTSRYRGATCDIVPQTCLSYYDISIGSCNNNEVINNDVAKGMISQTCRGSHRCGCSGIHMQMNSGNYYPSGRGYIARENPLCANSDHTC